MSVSVESTGDIERCVIVELPAKDVDGKVDSRLKESAKNVRINGYRPGKVPVREIKRRYGDSIRYEVVGELADKAYREAVAEHGLTVATDPSIEFVQNEAGKDVKFKAILEVYPEIKLEGLDQIKVVKPVVEITQDDIQNIMDQVRKRHATWETKEGAAELNDQVLIDFEGFVDGEAFEGGQATDFDLVLGSGKLIPGFEDQLVGKQAGDDCVVEVTFPEDYGSEQLKGKPAEFKVTVKSVSAEKLPEVDDAFAKEMGIEEGGAEKLIEEITNNMQTQLDRSVRNELNKQVFDQMASIHTIAIPKGPVVQEMHRRRKEMTQSLQAQHKISQEQLESIFPLETFKEQAEHSVKVALLLGEYIDQEKLDPTEEQIEAKLDELARGYTDAESLKKSYRDDPNRMNWVRATVIEDLAVERLMSGGQVTEKTFSYDDAINGKFGDEAEQEESETAESVE